MSPPKSKSCRLKAAKVGRPSQLVAGSSSSQAHVPWTPPPTASSSTCYVFRSVVTSKTWDQFEPLHASSSSANLSGFLLRACSSSTATVSHENHLNMGWNHSIRSPYISFSTDLEWAIYYQLKQEHVNNNNPSRVRHLYALEVLADDVQSVSVTDPRAKSNARTAKEMLGTLQVRVVRHLSLMDLIPPVLRDMSLDWFGRQKRFAKLMSIPIKYPFLEWRGYVRLNYQQELDAMACAVDAWKTAVQPTKSVQMHHDLQRGMQAARNNSTSHKNHRVSEPLAPVVSPPTLRLPISTSKFTPPSTSTDHLSISIPPPAAHSSAADTGTSAAANSPSSPSRADATEATPLLATNTGRRHAATSNHTNVSIAANRIDYSVSREARALQALHARYLPQHQLHAETPLAETASRSLSQIVKGTVWELLCWMWDRLKVLVRGNEMRAEEASLA